MRKEPNQVAELEKRLWQAADDVFPDPGSLVVVLAVGAKERNVVRIGNEVVTL